MTPDVETLSLMAARLGDEPAVLSTATGRVSVLRHPGDRHLPPDLVLLEVREVVPPGVVALPDGFAVLPDGRVLPLSEPAGLGAFWACVGKGRPPVTLAALVTRYSPLGRGDGSPQNLVVRRADVPAYLRDAHLEDVDGFIELESRIDPDGGLYLEFCSFWLARPQPGAWPAAGLNRWTVTAAGGTVRCVVRSLSRPAV